MDLSNLTDPSAAAYEALLQFVYQAPVGLVQTTLAGEIVLINPMSARLLLPLAPDGGLLNLFDVLAPVVPRLREIAAGAAQPGSVLCEALRFELPAPSNTPDAAAPASTPQVLSIRLLRLDGNMLMATLSDVTLAVQQEQQRLVRRLRHATRIDRLTAMPNRTVAVEHIERALRTTSLDAAHRFAVLFINVDRFERINVALGQSVGNELLRQIAGRINASLRDTDAVTAARLGGDEFVVVLESAGDAAVPALVVAQRLTDLLCRPYAANGSTVHLAISMGVLVRAHAAGDADSVLQDASLAMREAKRGGGARCVLFEPSMKAQARQRASIESELREAIDGGQLFVVYQPIVDLATDAVAGLEALVRWRHPQRGIVPPIEFIGIAEETGLIGRLGEFVLDEACRQFADWQVELGGQAPHVLSVNLSRAQLVEPTIGLQVRRALKRSGLAARQLQLEVTESLAAQDGLIQQRLRDLKALGLTLALDDFGTGYSSLASLHQLPIDVVKIDRAFVSQLETSAHHRVLVEAVIKVARSLAMGTVAEGIETERQAALLAQLQCDKGQGYRYAKPLPATEVAAWIAARAANRGQLRCRGLARIAGRTGEF